MPLQPGTFRPGVAIQMQGMDWPSLSARAFGVRIELDDFDLEPPSVTFRDAWTWELLKYPLMLRANNVDESGQALGVILDAHPVTKRPFLCMRGIREYHTHPQHTGDDWMLYRGNFGVFDVLATVWRTCVDQARPNLILGVNQPTVNWEPTGN
jgi:hypothetical protein